MQEYGVLFLKGLVKGVRPFPAGPLPDPMLTECWNLMPTETGLIGHDKLTQIGIPAIGFEFLAIFDQSGFMWYWTADYDGKLEIWDEKPTHPVYEVIDVTPETTPWWGPIEDELGTIWYLYPEITTGQPIISIVQPPVGNSVLELGWHIRSIFFENWQLYARGDIPTYYSQVWRPPDL